MAQNFPSLQQLKNTFLLEYESNINQDSPLNNKALLRLSSAVEAMIAMLMQREVSDNTKQNFALTASREKLISVFGVEYDLPIKDEVSTVLTVTLPATTGTVIPAGTNFTGDDNGILYFNSVPVTSVASVATLSLTARTPGVIGNLLVGQTLSISRSIAGAELVATITVIDTAGADAEKTEVYRKRVLDIIRAPGGGGNSADYRNWSQEQENIDRTFPYAGLPFDDPLFPGEPPERTVYCEASTSFQIDGIPDAPLLAATKLTIITNPVTGLERQPLGLTNDTLHTEPIRRTGFYTTITNAVFLAGTEAAVKIDIATAVDSYYLSLNPFVQGLDIDADRNDKITAVSASKPIQAILSANGASADSVTFSDTPPASVTNNYQLGQGEKAKNAGITYN